MVLSLLACLVGGIVYLLLNGSPKPNRAAYAELGRISFAMGLLAYLIVLGQHVVRP